MDLTVSYYWNSILATHRGVAHGIPSNAKPIFLLAILAGIEEGFILGNQIKYEAPLEEKYLSLCRKYEPGIKPAGMFKPFYHSAREEYYNLKWKEGKVPEHNWHTPSASDIKKHIDFAYLDDGFWEILQQDLIRDEFRNLIINHFINTDK